MLVPESDIEKTSRLNTLRQRVLAGETIPAEEYRGIIDALRVRRKADIESATAAKAKSSGRKSAAKSETSDEELGDILASVGMKL